MQCSLCRSGKLSQEFPTQISASCMHAPSTCLACLIKVLDLSSLETMRKKSCPECSAVLTAPEVQELLHADLWQSCCFVFQDVDALKAQEQEALADKLQRGIEDKHGQVDVALLDGRRCSIDLSTATPLSEVKTEIKRRLGVPTAKQRLLYRGRDLNCSDNIAQGDQQKWGDLDVPFGSVLQLVVIMYQTGSSAHAGAGQSAGGVSRMHFNLSWRAGFERKHLNGTCIALDESGGLLGLADFRHTRFQSVHHGGPSTSSSSRQQLTVNVTGLSQDCEYLFFALSAFAPAGLFLRSFADLKVELTDASSMKSLASYTAGQATSSEAIILCMASRDEVGWLVEEVGRQSSGNHRDYGPLVDTAKRIMQQQLS